MKKFEYKTLTFSKKFYAKGAVNADEELNKMGREGWECVNAYSPVGSGLDVCYLFKRELQN